MPNNVETAVRWRGRLTRWGEIALDPSRVMRKSVYRSVEFIAPRVIRRTPVRTGLARGNWRIAFDGRVSANPIGVRDPSGARTIANILTSATRFAARSSFRLYNSVPYIERLELGWSRQAPQGMVRLTMQEFLASQSSVERKVLRDLEVEITLVTRSA